MDTRPEQLFRRRRISQLVDAAHERNERRRRSSTSAMQPTTNRAPRSRSCRARQTAGAGVPAVVGRSDGVEAEDLGPLHRAAPPSAGCALARARRRRRRTFGTTPGRERSHAFSDILFPMGRRLGVRRTLIGIARPNRLRAPVKQQCFGLPNTQALAVVDHGLPGQRFGQRGAHRRALPGRGPAQREGADPGAQPPSGDPTPSPDDLHLTAEAVAAGRLLDVAALDHLIIGHGGYVSLRDRGVAFADR